MAVRTQQGLTRDAKAFHMEGMADAVARAAVPEAELLTGTAQKEVIIGIFIIGLQ
jgi:hypothetical protein